MMDSSTNNEEIYEHTFATDVYALAWTVRTFSTIHAPQATLHYQYRRDQHFRLAVGSFVQGHANHVDIITRTQATGRTATQCNMIHTVDHEHRAFVQDTARSFSHPYPPTKLAFVPDPDGTRPDLLATTSDFLRLWHIQEDGVQLEKTLSTNRNAEYCAPLTSFDWNEVDPKRLGTSSIDTTCTIWDVEVRVIMLCMYPRKSITRCMYAPTTEGGSRHAAHRARQGGV